MSKTILAFVAVAATAVGQDVVLEPAIQEDYSPTPYIANIDQHGSFSIGWSLIRRRDKDSRPFVTFDLSKITQDVQSAAVRFRPQYGIGGRGYEDSRLIFHDAAPYVWWPLFTTPLDDRKQIWEDLGSGSFYGEVDISPDALGDEWTYHTDGSPRHLYMTRDLEIQFSPLAIRDINQSDGYWGFGTMLPIFPPEVYDDPTYIVSAVSYWPSLYLDLTYGPPPPLGDFDGSDRVDQDDLDFVLLNWGLVDQEELDAVLLTWGHSTPLAASGIPEPPTMPLAAACVIMAAIGSLSWSRRPCRH